MQNGLPHWREYVKPHRDIRDNEVSEALFAVNLSRAIDRQGAEEYRDPVLFFQRTHLTRTLKSLIVDVLKTLYGDPGANSIIHLQTNFGGGKTHAELALYHLLHTPEVAAEVPALGDFLVQNSFQSVEDIPRAAVAVLPCADLYAGGREIEDGIYLHTIWGEMAYRLGSSEKSGAELYEIVRKADVEKTSPGVVTLRKLLDAAGPNLILIDEMLHYVDKAAAIKVGDSNLGTQALGFLRELTEAVEAVDHSVLVASVTASSMEDLQVLTEETAQSTLAKMEDILRRVEDSRTPIEGSEIFEIIRTRLFEEVDPDVAEHTAAAYYEFYKDGPWRDILPQQTRDPGYRVTLEKSYPFHPSIVSVLYERWGSRPQFQLTRGTLRFLSHLLAALWQQENHSKSVGALVHLADVDLSDDDVRAETVRVAGSEWESIIGTDIATAESGSMSISQRRDREHGGLYQSFRLVEGIATSVFMFTHGGQQSKSTPLPDVRLAVVRPELPAADVNQAFDDCKARLYYYYEEDGGYIFKTEPNPNKVLADARVDVSTDEARRKIEEVVEDVVGQTAAFNVVFYDFHHSQAHEPGDVPDDGKLQLVVLPPRLPISRGSIGGRTLDVIRDITQNYGKKLRLNRNMVLFLLPDSDYIAGAIERAIDWRAAQRVMGDAALMARFSDIQQELIRDKATTAQNDTKDHVRKAYNIVALPSGTEGQSVAHEPFELSYVPPSKKVIEQAEEELRNKGKLLRDFNPALFDSRWASLWPKTATMITVQAIWEKFTRQAEAPILMSADVLRQTIKQGVEQQLFGMGVLRDAEADKFDAASYEALYYGPYDAGELNYIEVGQRTVLIRAEQVDVIFPPISKEEVAMLLDSPRQSVNQVFEKARSTQSVQGRVDQDSFFTAITEGVNDGLFGYVAGSDAPIVRGDSANLKPSQVRFSGTLIGEDVPLPITAQEIAQLIPDEGRIPVKELYELSLEKYGTDRVSEQSFMNALQRCISNDQFGYADDETGNIQTGLQSISVEGYIGTPEALPADTRVIVLSGSISSVEFANVIKAAMSLSKLGDSSITLNLRIELQGEVNEHSITMAISELRSRVPGLKIDDLNG